MGSFVEHMLQSYGYFAVFAFIALESMGIPLPGESSLIAAALYAGSTRHLDIRVVFVVAAVAAVLGDNAGYWFGRRGGARLVRRFGRYVHLDESKLAVGRYLFAGHGGKVVFYGRFMTVLRTYAALFAGLSEMRWRRFLGFNAAGALAWSALYAFGAFGLGSAATAVGSTLTYVGLGLTVVLTATMFIWGRRAFHRLEARAREADDSEARRPARQRANRVADGREGPAETAPQIKHAASLGA